MPKIENNFLKSQRVGPSNFSVRKLGHNSSIDRAISAAVRRSKGKYEKESSDTDSLASSMSSYSGITHNNKAGVSPLNRRKSLRLALKKTSDMPAMLHTQNTVVMTTPPQSQSIIQRMETAHRWTGHRGSLLKSQETVILPRPSLNTALKPAKLAKGMSKWVNYRREESGETCLVTKHPRLAKIRSRSMLGSLSSSSGVSLLRKMSTTWGIRQALGETCLAPDNVDGKAGSTRGKKSARGSLPPISEKADKKLKVKREVTFAASAASTSFCDKSPRKSALKRRRSASLVRLPTEDERMLHQTKRMCLEGKGVGDASSEPVYMAPQRDWPISMDSQVAWRLNLGEGTDQPGTGEARCAYVDNDRCLVGTQAGLVYELDASVTPSRMLDLPAAVSCLASLGAAIYAGCVDGSVYDISSEESRVFWKEDGFQEITYISCSEQKIAVIDCQGKVAVMDNSGETLWKEETFHNKQADRIHIDDKGVYVAHLDLLTKYSLEGVFVWGIDGVHLTSTVTTVDELYSCRDGDVHKIDKYGKGRTLLTYNKGRAETGLVQHCAVGGGLVFAAGKQLVCYDEKSGEVVYIVKLPSTQQLVSMQYFQMRLFCLFDHSLEVLDFTEHSLITGKEGHQIATAEVRLPAPPPPAAAALQDQLSASSVTSVASSVTSQATAEEEGSEQKPKARRGKLKVKTVSVKKKNG